MHDLHVYNHDRQVIFNGNFARENLTAPGIKLATFRPTTPILLPHLPYRFLGLLLVTQHGWALTGTSTLGNLVVAAVATFSVRLLD